MAKKPIINVSSSDSVIHALFEKHQRSIQDCWDRLVATEADESVTAFDLLSEQLRAVELEGVCVSDTALSVDVGDCSRRVPALLINAGASPPAANHRPVSGDPRFPYLEIYCAIGLGVSMLLNDLSGEMPTGARVLFFDARRGSSLQEGQTATFDSHVRALYGLDLNPYLPPGTVGLKTGPIFSSKSSFDISLSCENTEPADHCASQDLIQAASRLCIALHQAASRQIDPLTPVTVAVSSMNSGEDSATGRQYVRLMGMFRSMDDSLDGQIKSLIQSTIAGVVSHRGVAYTLELKQNSPVIYNDRSLQEKVAETAGDLVGTNAVRRLQYQGGEDDCLAEFYRSIPGLVLQLGAPDLDALSSQNPEHRWLELKPTIETAVKVLSRSLSQGATEA